jgi:hypothetical protein
MVGIFYEILHAKRIIEEDASLLTGFKLKAKVFFSVWISAISISLPGMDTYQLEGDCGIIGCEKVNDF